jgi:acetyl-CoA acetyltransferase
VLGIGNTEYSWDSGRSEAALAMEAIRRAVDDAGLALHDVDGMVRYSIESTTPSELVGLLGVPPLRFAADDGNGGGSACGLLGLADAAIRTGRARVVVAYRAFNARSELRLGRPPPTAVIDDGETIRGVGPSPAGEFGACYGLLAPAHIFALWSGAYMHRHGIDAARMEHALTAVVARQRAHASRNPNALLRDRPLAEDYPVAEPMIAEPLRRSDLCLESDGACAVVLADAALAADAPEPPVALLGATQSIIGGYQQMFLGVPELPPRPPRHAIEGLLARAGVALTDVDVLGTYDACSANVVFDVESIGWCEPGEGVDWVEHPAVAGNTSGGLLSEAYLQGMNHVLELVRQLRGDAPDQVPGAELALATGPAVTSAALLAKGDAR